MDLGGYPVTLADTAGLRAAEPDGGTEGQPGVEAEGIRRAHARAATADLKLAVFDLRDAAALDPVTVALVDADTLVVLNKCDLVSKPERVDAGGRLGLPISAKTGAGMAELLARLEAEVEARLGGGGASAAVTRVRHRRALEDCAAALDRAAAGSGPEPVAPELAAPEPVGPELVAEDLRLALRALGRITGRVDVEDVLDVIFRDFCIGK